MSRSTILRLRRTDKAGQHLLLNVSQSGPGALDLKLIGTEHTHLYHARIKESEIRSFQASSYGGGLDEWKAILRFALLQQRPEETAKPALHDLETVAAVSGSTLTVTVRKNVAGIAQRLGSIKLEEDDEREEVSAFDWVDAAVAHSDEVRGQLETLQASVASQQEQVTRLSKQLDDLVQAKNEHEGDLLKKFAALLNSKKLKIRDQQRLLAKAKIDPQAAEVARDARSDFGSSRKPGGSRSGKRKAAVDSGEVEMPGDAADNGDNDDESDDETGHQETPQASDDETTEDEDDLDRSAPGAEPNDASESNGRKGPGTVKQHSEARMDVDDPGELPPRRNLPFSTKSAKAVEPVPNDDDDETDDELN